MVKSFYVTPPALQLHRHGFSYDLVDITRQVLANYAFPLQRKWVNAYEAGDSTHFKYFSNQYLELVSDMDKLLATRKDFMLGPWIAAARSQGNTVAEKDLYEQNARDLITLWGDANSPLHEYANRQWSGLLNNFYKPRWQQFFSLLQQSLRTGTTPDFKAFDKDISQWEWHWVKEHNSFPVETSGNSITVSLALYKKYWEVIVQSYS